MTACVDECIRASIFVDLIEFFRAALSLYSTSQDSNLLPASTRRGPGVPICTTMYTMYTTEGNTSHGAILTPFVPMLILQKIRTGKF